MATKRMTRREIGKRWKRKRAAIARMPGLRRHAQGGTGKAVAAGAATLVAAIDGLTRGWFSLNPQVRWAIDDRILAALPRGTDRGDLAGVKIHMDDGTETFWYKWWQLSAAEQRASVRRAAERRMR